MLGLNLMDREESNCTLRNDVNHFVDLLYYRTSARIYTNLDRNVFINSASQHFYHYNRMIEEISRYSGTSPYDHLTSKKTSPL